MVRGVRLTSTGIVIRADSGSEVLLNAYQDEQIIDNYEPLK